jgi:glycosyltransferase involved in cell wall biosynthesis
VNKVSVIIPCFNATKHVLRAVESVLEQKKIDLELICVDNNSSDDTLEVLRARLNKVPNAMVLSEKKKGASAARNRGLKEASGNWIQFLDADDFLMPHKIAKQIELLESTEEKEISLIVGNSVKQTLDGKKKEIIYDANDPWISIIRLEIGNTCSNLFNKSYLSQIGGWNEELKSSQEFDLMFRILQCNDKILFDNVANTVVVATENSISHKDIPGNISRIIEVQKRIKAHLVSANTDPELVSLLNNMIFSKVRELANFDYRLAKVHHDALFNRDFIPDGEEFGVSASYSKMYRKFGFSVAQKTQKVYSAFK